MDTRGRCWSITINNPDDMDEANMRNLPKSWVITGQLEEGESGTRHYQLMLKTPTVRWAAVKKHFGKAHIELARDPQALAKYVHKAKTRIEGLPPKIAKDVFMNQMIERAIELMVANDTQCLPDYDALVSDLIEDGQHVEYQAAAPVNRLVWRKYGASLVTRFLSTDKNKSIRHNIDEDADDDTGSIESTGLLEEQHVNIQTSPEEQGSEQESDEGSEGGSEEVSEDDGGDEVSSVSDDEQSDCSV